MQQIKTFRQAHTALARFIPPLHAMGGGHTLERMRALAEYLGNPQQAYQVIHIAGTSGKTSTAYYLTSLLKHSGKKVGLTVSPFVDEINERVQVNGRPLEEKQFCQYLTRYLRLIEKSGIKPSYYELLIAFAFWVFAQEEVEYAVIEVGMGGLLDYTNIITGTQKVCVITDIGIDHTDVLGKKITEITAQKAGIIKPHNLVFMYDQGDEIMDVVREVCDQSQAELHEVQAADPRSFPQQMPLFQRRNWHLAESVFHALVHKGRLVELDESKRKQAMSIYIPGRMELLQAKNKTIVLDGAHNEQKLSALAESLKRQFPGKRFAVLVSMGQRKGVRAKNSLGVITKFAQHMILTAHSTTTHSPKRPVNPIKLAEYCHKLGYDDWEMIEDVKHAFTALLERREEIIVVTGSFYLLHDIRTLVTEA